MNSMNRTRRNLLAKKMAEISDDDGLLTDLVTFCLIELENRDNHSLPHRLFSTNLYRLPLSTTKPVLNDVIKRGLRHCLSRKAYPDTIDTNLRSYLEHGYLPMKVW
jgi:hypothetical protein